PSDRMAAVRDTSSIGFLLLWILSAIVGAVGLALAYGFREPPVSDRAITGLLMASGVLLLVSRLALLVPRGLIGPRMRCWWPDFVLLAAAIVWLIAEPFRAPVILRLAVLYAIAYGLGLLLWNGVLRVTDMRSPL